MRPLLQFEQVSAGYDRAVILDDVSFTLEEGHSVALLGRNGVGKSTLIGTIMGATRLHRGAIQFAGAPLHTIAPHRRAAAGLGWVAQERWVFPSLSVRENLTVAARRGPWTLQRIHALFPRLQERSANMGNQLSGGEQQMLAIARALMLQPRLLLLDEPLEGLAPVIVEQLTEAIGTMSRTGDLSLLLVEQHAHQALAMTRHAIVMDRGRIVHDGSSAELLADRGRLEAMIGLG
ncbi:ABC transporter ATP-binding protein [Verticiella sediminum]|uniref:ABC transporter ATP-binding protein n=1 Tax=Verticiella sediminum TaxID=1247510 RepID=A0A556AFW7_9BURK|nr:ABC transporter ATP-binding protein [Verticiella sediminum]TSH91784.1 ABC transporter ATP-binding protein [Verticiella sediminum]